MELKYRLFVYIGVLTVAVLAGLYLFIGRKPRKRKDGVKLSGTYVLDNDEYYVKKKKQYTVLIAGLALSVAMSIIAASALIARPYLRQKITEEKYCRDIILCLDVSTSVDELNERLVGELKNTVMQLEGERFGIVVFNTSPVVLSPLTDDHEYTLETLDNIQKALKQRIKMTNSWWYSYDDDWYYWDSYISNGTLIGNEERGSSLIGDGLAATIRNFSLEDEDRTKIVILSTDNEPFGDELLDLPDAAALCKEYGITVYGIGTKEMNSGDLREMKDAVESTGGAFFLEETSGTTDAIVKKIEGHSASLVKGDTYFVDHDMPKFAFTWLVAGIAGMYVFAWFLKK